MLINDMRPGRTVYPATEEDALAIGGTVRFPVTMETKLRVLVVVEKGADYHTERNGKGCQGVIVGKEYGIGNPPDYSYPYVWDARRFRTNTSDETEKRIT
jgi:hypothetical protein